MRRLAAVLSVLLLSACNERDSNNPDSLRARASFESALACVSDSFEGTRLTQCIADPARHRIAMVLGPAGGQPYRSFSAFAAAEPQRARRVAFAMNGGMFDDAGRPIGYYVADGKRGHTLNRAEGPGNFHLMPNGVFFGTGRQWGVLTAERFSLLVKVRPEFGTQSGPMLVIGGKLHPRIAENGESQYIRNAVGVDRQGRAHFVISEEPLSFGRLARYFRDRLKVPNALFLDGNVSSLWHPASGRMDETVPLGPLIVVENRAKAGDEKGTP